MEKYSQPHGCKASLVVLQILTSCHHPEIMQFLMRWTVDLDYVSAIRVHWHIVRFGKYSGSGPGPTHEIGIGKAIASDPNSNKQPNVGRSKRSCRHVLLLRLL